MTLRGIDISDFQAGIDIGSLPDDLDFVVIKATEGKGYVSPSWKRQYDDARAAGCLVGLYHFARNDLGGETRADDEANYFLNTIGDAPIGEAVLVLDWERAPMDDVAWVKRWLDRVYERTGVRAMVYMSEWPAKTHDWSSISTKHGLWCAKYADNVPDYGWDMSSSGPAPDVPKWPWKIWQWTSVGKLPGWSGNLDLNQARIDVNAWAKLAAPEGEILPPAEPCPSIEEITAVVDAAVARAATPEQVRDIVADVVVTALENIEIPTANEIASLVTSTVRAVVREELSADRTLSIDLPITVTKATPTT